MSKRNEKNSNTYEYTCLFGTFKLSKIGMYKFWYSYVKQKYREKAKLCYMDTDTVYMKTDDIYKDIAEYVETRFNTSNYEFNRPLPKVKNKVKIIVGLKAKT